MAFGGGCGTPWLETGPRGLDLRRGREDSPCLVPRPGDSPDLLRAEGLGILPQSPQTLSAGKGSRGAWHPWELMTAVQLVPGPLTGQVLPPTELVASMQRGRRVCFRLSIECTLRGVSWLIGPY